MKAITLHQPFASLIALGAKTIETRGWSTSYRGPLAIHAAKRTPDTELLEDGWAGELYGGDGIDSCLAQWFETSEEDYIPDRLPAPEMRWSLALAPEFLPVTMPLGAVIATCDLVDVVPMVRMSDAAPSSLALRWGGSVEADIVTAHLLRLIDGVGIDSGDMSDQLPYGNFSPGRFAWVLADIKPLTDPIPVRGRQGLWEWDASELAIAEGVTS